MPNEKNELIAEIKRLRERVQALEGVAEKSKALETEIQVLKDKIEDKTGDADFIDWDA